MTHVTRFERVTLALCEVLRDRMERGREVAFSFGPPELGDGEAERPRVNLFLYHVSESPLLQNVPRESPVAGGAARSPGLRWDLHYLLCTYGTTGYPGGGPACSGKSRADLEAQGLLCDAMHVLRGVGHLLLRSSEPGPRPSPHPGEEAEGPAETLRVELRRLGPDQPGHPWRAWGIGYQRAAAYDVRGLRGDS